MLKRRIIRGIFLLPVVLCLAGWGWSGWYEGAIDYVGGHRWIDLGTVYGAVYLVGGRSTSESDQYGGDVRRTNSVRFWPEIWDDSLRFLGFRWRHVSYGSPSGAAGSGYELDVPYWFPLLFSSLLLLGAWRKTRRTSNPAMAFPVVMKDGAPSLFITREA